MKHFLGHTPHETANAPYISFSGVKPDHFLRISVGLHLHYIVEVPTLPVAVRRINPILATLCPVHAITSYCCFCSGNGGNTSATVVAAGASAITTASVVASTTTPAA